jgi:glycosyltransferase involved in cell wall biosynthesis
LAAAANGLLEFSCRQSPYTPFPNEPADGRAPIPYFEDVPPVESPSPAVAATLLSSAASAATNRTAADRSYPPASPVCPAISATILTKNSEALLARVLTALEWCDEVVVLDTGSTDATVSIAVQFANVSLHQLNQPFSGFGRVRQLAVSLARNDWIFSVDADEIVSPELRNEITSRRLDAGAVYAIPFANYFNGRHITTCGWAPDCHERLFNRTRTNFCASNVHERVQTAGLSTVHLHGSIDHYSYRSNDDFLRKMSAYSQLFATQNAGRKRSSPLKAVSRSLWAFFKSYVLERGLTQGTEGMVISAYKAQTVFWKYMMLHEANQNWSRSRS